jgi:O-antigen/teichoic acid export membrane protein
MAVTIGRNTVFGIASSAVVIGTRFVMVPVVIYHLGLGGYGIWSVIMATAGYLRFGSAGIKSAFQKYVAEATGNGDFETANKLLSTGSISMLGLSLAVLIPVAILSRALATASGVPPNFLHAAAASITLLALIMVGANFGAAYEAILTGGHRIDLTRSFAIATTVSEAIAIITLLHFGYGLFAMAMVMAASELVYVILCYFASRVVVPEIRISLQNFTSSVFRELIRFALSYQVVNVLEVLYGMLLPVIILKYFGADLAGVYAVVSRLVTAAAMGQDATILPLLSGGTLIFALGSRERTTRFLKKAFKTTLAITLAPLSFVAAFGTVIILAWTGQSGSAFKVSLWLVCAAAFFQCVSRLQLILYRASGNALHDNLRQAFRLGALLILAFLGRRIGFYGVLAGVLLAEFVGVLYMFFALKSAMPEFHPSNLFSDASKVIVATGGVIAVGTLATVVHYPWGTTTRSAALFELCAVVIACLAASWPALAVTKVTTGEERKAVLALLMPWKRRGVISSSVRSPELAYSEEQKN